MPILKTSNKPRKIRGGRSDDPEDTKKQPIKPQPKKRREADIDTEEEEVSREMNPFPEIASHRDKPLSEMHITVALNYASPLINSEREYIQVQSSLILISSDQLPYCVDFLRFPESV